MYLYGKEIELIDHFLVESSEEKLCDKCKEAQEKKEQRECLEQHCSKVK